MISLMTQPRTYKYIFEGAELVGKSSLALALHTYLLECQTDFHKSLADCNFMDCDTGLFSTPLSTKYLFYMGKIFTLLRDTNIVVDKFHLSDTLYHELFHHKEVIHTKIEKKMLRPLGFSIILVTLPEDLFLERYEKRIKQRNITKYGYPQRPFEFYLAQQKLFQKLIQKTLLPHLIIDGSLPIEENLRHIISAEEIPMIGTDESLLAKIQEFLVK
jgi:hypothetical protein